MSPLALRQTAEQAPQHAVEQPQHGVTELVLPASHGENSALVLPMLAHLSKQAENRWISWIAPPKIDKAQLISSGVDLNKLRLIHLKPGLDPLWATWEALAAGNSHTVIASPGSLNEKAFTALEKAARQGICHGLLIRLR